MFTIVEYPTKEIVATLPTYRIATAYLIMLSEIVRPEGEVVELTETFLTVKGEKEIVYSIEAI